MAKRIACPHCGGPMTKTPGQAPDEVAAANAARGGGAAQATKFAETYRAKVEALGYVYTCGSCGYKSRLKADAPPAPEAGENAA